MSSGLSSNQQKLSLQWMSEWHLKLHLLPTVRCVSMGDGMINFRSHSCRMKYPRSGEWLQLWLNRSMCSAWRKPQLLFSRSLCTEKGSGLCLHSAMQLCSRLCKHIGKCPTIPALHSPLFCPGAVQIHGGDWQGWAVPSSWWMMLRCCRGCWCPGCCHITTSHSHHLVLDKFWCFSSTAWQNLFKRIGWI